MSSVYTRYELTLASNVVASLRQHEEAALRVDSAMSRVQDRLGAIATVWAAHKVFDIGKEWVQGAADYETAMQRIMNVSFNASEGLKNQLFIKEEVDKFKIDLQGATDAFGDFLTMVRGSGLASKEVRQLHDEVLMISKVTHIPQSQMDAAVRNLGKLLEEGTLESKHLRPLTYQLSGFMPYLSKELGMSNQELEKSISSGALTKSAVDSRVLMEAIEKYASDLAPKLGESLATIQSNLTDLDNTWTEFKNDTVMYEKAGLVEVFASLKEGIIYLHDNIDTVVKLGEAVFKLIEFYVAYRVAAFAMMGVTSLVNAGLSVQIGKEAALTGAITGETAAMQRLIVALEQYIFMQNEATVSAAAFAEAQQGLIFLNTEQMLLTRNSAAMNGLAAGSVAANAQRGIAQGGVAATAGAAALGSRIVGSVTSAMMVVGVAWVAAEVLEYFGAFGKKSAGSDKSFKDWLGIGDWGKSEEGQYQHMQNDSSYNPYERSWYGKNKFLGQEEQLNYDNLLSGLKAYPKGEEPKFDREGKLIPWGGIPGVHQKDLVHNNDYWLKKSMGLLPEEQSAEEGHGHKMGNTEVKSKLKSSNIRGNSVTTINIDINQLNGLNQCTFEVRNQKDMDDIKDRIGTEVTRILTDSINDAQVIKK